MSPTFSSGAALDRRACGSWLDFLSPHPAAWAKMRRGRRCPISGRDSGPDIVWLPILESRGLLAASADSLRSRTGSCPGEGDE